jgi:hypothetical protein
MTPDLDAIRADRKMWEATDADPLGYYRDAWGYIDDLLAEVERLRAAGQSLEAALNQIDCAVMPPDQAAEDTKAVGGPVSMYSVDYDEQAVVSRARAEVARLRECPDRAARARFLSECHQALDGLPEKSLAIPDAIRSLRAEVARLRENCEPGCDSPIAAVYPNDLGAAGETP